MNSLIDSVFRVFRFAVKKSKWKKKSNQASKTERREEKRRDQRRKRKHNGTEAVGEAED